MEEWKFIPGYKGWYSASTNGNIRRDKEGSATYKGRILNKQTTPSGYSIVSINNIPNNNKTYKVAFLITLTFLGNRPINNVINHKNGIKTDDRICNLEYISQSMNVIHAYRYLGHKAINGKNHWNGKKTHCNRGHEYLLNNTYTDKNNKRTCISCRTIRKRLWRLKQTKETK